MTPKQMIAMGSDPTTGSPPMIGRAWRMADWLGYVRDYDFGPVAPSRVVLHHTWKPTVDQWRGLASMKGMQRFYAGKGWTAAPHIYVGPEAGANIWQFTPLSRIGIHAGTGNSGRINGRLWYSLGVEMVGDYDNVRPSGHVWDSTKVVLGSLSLRLAIPPEKLISFHRDYTNQKSCPGWAVTKEWVWAEVADWMRGRHLPAPQPTLLPSAAYAVRSVAIVRSEPNVPAQIVQRLVAPAIVQVVGSTDQGQQVAGSSTWYITKDQHYIHSGALRKVD